MDWRYGAACRGLDTDEAERFFPLNEDADEAPQRRAVAAVVGDYCRPCPVRAECLAWALDSGQDAGVWGGLSTPERRRLRAPERAAAAVAAALERRAAEDAAADAQEDAQRPARRRHRPGRTGTSRGKRVRADVGRCPVCSTRRDLRVDGSMVRHDRTSSAGPVPCDGAGRPSVPESLPADR